MTIVNMGIKDKMKKICFICKYIVVGNHKTIIFNGLEKNCCLNCKSSDHRPLEARYRNSHTDLQCSTCSRAVTGRNCLSCSICNHFVHLKCSSLTKNDINHIIYKNQSWTCHHCFSTLFPFSNVNTISDTNTIPDDNKEQRKCNGKKACYFCNNNNKNNFPIYYHNTNCYICFTCSNNTNTTDVEYLDCNYYMP